MRLETKEEKLGFEVILIKHDSGPGTVGQQSAQATTTMPCIEMCPQKLSLVPINTYYRNSRETRRPARLMRAHES
jgi:hypothetical protein